MGAFNGALYALAAGKMADTLETYEALVARAPGGILPAVLEDVRALRHSGPWDEQSGARVIELIETARPEVADAAREDPVPPLELPEEEAGSASAPP
jgi:hypothetical protein